MTDTSFSPRDEDDALAAEYVLGVLDLADRLSAETRAKREPEFAALIVAWQNRLEGLNDAYDEAPAPDLMPRIEARLFPKAAPVARERRFNWFGLLGGVGLAATIALAAFIVLPTAEPDLVATLAAGDNSLSYTATFQDERLVVTRVAGTPAPAGQVHELWIIAPGAAPVSLGLLAEAPLTLEYPTPPAGWVLAVSVEPTGGSPTGAPTGPVILTAEISA